MQRNSGIKNFYEVNRAAFIRLLVWLKQLQLKLARFVLNFEQTVNLKIDSRHPCLLLGHYELMMRIIRTSNIRNSGT